VIKPMLAKSSKPFDSDGWIYENKLDGVRCIATLNNGVELQARSGRDITYKFPELADIAKQVSKPCILDGEIVCLNFSGIQHRIHREYILDIKAGARRYPATYYVFDILNLDGESLITKPLIQRKATLASTFTTGRDARLLAFQNGYGISLFEKVKACGGEGIMAKQLYSPYILGKRSNYWLKIKCFVEDTFYICGLTRGENDRARTFGSVILGKANDGELTYVGCAGSGLTDVMLNRILRLDRVDKCPFKQIPDLDRKLLTWIMPNMLCEVRYLGFGSNGHIRFPSFRRLKGEK